MLYRHLHDARLLQRNRIKKRPRRAALLLASLLISQNGIIFTPLPAAAEEPSRVIIQEIAWAGSGTSSFDEWIELANLGEATATIGGWSLAGAGQSERSIFLPDDASISPQGTYLIANYAEDDEHSALAVFVDVATTTVSLSNTSLGITLRDANGNTVDAAGDGMTPFAGTADPRGSMLRNSTSTTAYAWVTAASSTGFKDGITDMGTPGSCDLCALLLTTPAEETTSTQDETTTNTDIVPSNEHTAPSTEAVVLPANSATMEALTATSTAETISTSHATTNVTPDSPLPPTSLPPYPLPPSNATTQASVPYATTQPTPPIQIQLNEAVSNPLSGPEWVELALAPDVSKTDRSLELWDASGRIANIAENTPVTVPGFLVVTLKSARLNNSGDEVHVREMNGNVLETTTIPKLDKGESWAKDDDGEWRITPLLTPAMENLFFDATEETTDAAAAHIITTSAESSATNAATQPNASYATTSYATTQPPTSDSLQSLSLSADLDAVFQAALLANEQAGDAIVATRKTSGALNGEIINTYSFDSMFDSNLNGARVRVTGIVGSVEKLLGASSHTFIIENEDGRGLLVYLPTHLNVPAYGSMVSVAGTLKATYRGPELRMKKTDVWMTLADEGSVAPRIVDLLAPGAEDAWSLVTVEGTVGDINSASFALQTDDGIDVTVSVPAAVGYRVARLTKQDRVRVTGLLDIRKDKPTVIIRRPQEIELLKHAPESIASPIEQNPQSRFPDWAPFVAAGGAITAVGFGKRFRELLKRKKLRDLMAKASTAQA